jgi:hypothetical protein
MVRVSNMKLLEHPHNSPSLGLALSLVLDNIGKIPSNTVRGLNGG